MPLHSPATSKQDRRIIMKNQTFFIDLTVRPPRSFRVRLGNYVILARMLDKGRATLAKKSGETNTTPPRINGWCNSWALIPMPS
jgi:hypothetical protein